MYLNIHMFLGGFFFVFFFMLLFFNILGSFLNKSTDLSQIWGLFISTTIFTESECFLVDSKRLHTIILTASTCTSSRNVFHNITNNGIDYGSIIADNLMKYQINLTFCRKTNITDSLK